MNKKFLVSLVVVLALGTVATIVFKQKNAQAAASGYEIGSIVTDFKLKNTDGTTFALSNYKDKKGVIVVFTCNHCPFAKAYEDRIIDLDKKFAASGFPVVAINPSDASSYDEDSFDKMAARAKEKAYTFPQATAKAFGAARTPHLFILKNEGGKFVVQYIGTIDDNAQDPASVTKRYVEDAIGNMLAGKPVVTTQTKAVGCSIKWKDA
jgi:glutathione peroxidase-family protein